MLTRLRVWLNALRPFSYTAAITPSLVGAALACQEGPVNGWQLGLFTTSAVLLLAGTNLTNEYYDDRRGLDRVQKIGHSGMIQAGLLDPSAVLRAALLAYALGFVIGLVLVIQLASWRLFILGLGGILAGYLYTGGPAPASYYPFGELLVFTAMGPGLVMGSYLSQTGRVSLLSAWVSLPIGLLVAAILHVNNVRDMEFDSQFGRITVPLLIGRPAARHEYALMTLGSYVIIGSLVLAAELTPWALLVFLTLPLVKQPLWTMYGTQEVMPLNRTLRQTAHLHAAFGILLALGIYLGTVT
jgi:1,4-dihydroxy-2-naphthoate octaprenyltransferase